MPKKNTNVIKSDNRLKGELQKMENCLLLGNTVNDNTKEIQDNKKLKKDKEIQDNNKLKSDMDLVQQSEITQCLEMFQKPENLDLAQQPGNLDLIQQSEIAQCKRGYKICKNLNCQQMIHINSRICKKCGQINQTKKSAPSNKNDNIDMFEQICKTEKGKNVEKKITKINLSNLKNFVKKKMFNNERYLREKRERFELSTEYNQETIYIEKDKFKISEQGSNLWENFIRQNFFTRKIEVDDKDYFIKMGQTLNFSRNESETIRSLFYIDHGITDIEVSNTYNTKDLKSSTDKKHIGYLSEYSQCCIAADFNQKNEKSDNIERNESQKILGLQYLGRVGVRYTEDSIVQLNIISPDPNNDEICMKPIGFFKTESDIKKVKINNYIDNRYIVACLGYDGNVQVHEVPFETVRSQAIKIQQNGDQNIAQGQDNLLENINLKKKKSNPNKKSKNLQNNNDLTKSHSLQPNLNKETDLEVKIIETQKLAKIHHKNEIFCAIEWLNFHEKLALLIGTQLGSVHLYVLLPKTNEKFTDSQFSMNSGDYYNKSKEDWLKQSTDAFLCRPQKVRTFNHYSNFLITSLNVMPGTSYFNSLFLLGTADGILKIFSLEKEDPIFEHQSLSKPLKDTYWDASSNLIVFSDENERHLVSLLHFSDTINQTSTAFKRFIKVPSFVEKISGSFNNDCIGFGTRTGELLTTDVVSLRKFFNKNKNNIALKQKLKITHKMNTITSFNTKKKFNEDSPELNKEDTFICKNVIRALCMSKSKISNKDYCVIGTADGFVSLLNNN